MEYFVSLDEINKRIEETKEKLLSVDDLKDEKKLYFTLRDLYTFKSIIEYNRDSLYKRKVKDIFSKTFTGDKQFEKFCVDSNYQKSFNVDCSDEMKEFMETDLIDSVLNIYNVFRMSKVDDSVSRNFSQEEVVSIVKDVYKDINNLHITSMALDFLDNGHIEFVKSMPHCYGFAAGLFALDDFVLVKRDENSIFDVIRLAHEVAHYIDSVLSPEFIDERLKIEWIPMTVGFITLDYMKKNNIITEEEYEVVMKRELYTISEYLGNTVLYDRSRSEYLISLVYASSYALAQKVMQDGDICGDELYRCIRNKNSFINFNRENNDFIVDELDKTKRFVKHRVR